LRDSDTGGDENDDSAVMRAIRAKTREPAPKRGIIGAARIRADTPSTRHRMPMKDYRPSSTLLAGRTILVTGAGADIGRAAALAYAAHGATVALLDRDTKPLEKLYDEIVNAGGPEPAALPLDLSIATQELCERTAHVIETELGRLDGILHTATESGTLTPVELYEPALWARVMQINFTARWLLTRACLPLLKKSPDAAIIFSTADVGRRARAYWGAYAAAAFATEGLMQVLADEIAANTNIRANSVDPGKVRTYERSRFYPGEDPATLREVASVMPTYLYLMGPDSKGVNGQALNASA
jgi:NAD(P)-dependent dehydrogenase (short-subunit alcohol dehydrogenase family)